MNRLRKKAWIDLIAAAACVTIGLTGVGLAIRFNASAAAAVTAFVTAGAVAFLLIITRKRAAFQRDFDEREQKIVYGAAYLSSSIFVLYLVLAAFISFFLAGGRGEIGSWLLPVLVLSGILIGALIQAVAILHQCPSEKENG